MSTPPASWPWPEILLSGQVALVTGAGSPYGIGRLTVLALAAAGAEVIYATDFNMVNMQDLARRVKEVNPGCTFVAQPFDVSSEEETHTIVKAIAKAHGRFDIYGANAGFINFQTINSVSTAHYYQAMNVMSRSVYYAIKYGSQAMAVTSLAKPSSSGKVVVITSVAGTMGSFSDMVYSASKHAACGLVRSGAVNLSASNIRIKAVAPGAFQTSLVSNSPYAAKGEKFDLVMTEA